jgi:hypothetical protein
MTATAQPSASDVDALGRDPGEPRGGKAPAVPPGPPAAYNRMWNLFRSAFGRLRHCQLAVARLDGQLGDRRDLGNLRRRFARDLGLGRVLDAEVRE